MALKILVPTAGSEAASAIADYVLATAKLLSASVVVLHITTESESQEQACLPGELFCEAGKKHGVSTIARTSGGEVIATILQVAEEEAVDLILMGASRGTFVEKWLSAGVMDKCAIPVLVVPHCYGN